MTTNGNPLLQMQNIKKDFFGNQVLTDINFTLGEGEVLGLCGENGAGKSTLMKILFGMDVIRETGGYSGDVLINGKKVEFNTPFDALEAGIGMVHQEFSLIPGFTATENILLNREPCKKNIVSEVFGDRMNTLDYKEMDRRSAAAIEKMGVAIDANMVISDMPVGHKQFTEIARELSKDQLKLLILDEPTAVLTEKEAEALLTSIRNMAARGISVIFITHRLHEILAVCDKVVVMRDGYVVRDVSAKETSVEDITKWMVGRDVQAAARSEARSNDGARTVMSIQNLWVDMPGETVRDVSLEIKEGEILGIGGLAGQGKLGIPNGVMGLYEAGDKVEVVEGDFPGLVGYFIPNAKSTTGNIVLQVTQSLATIAYNINVKSVRVLEFSKKSRRSYDQIDAFVPKLYGVLRKFNQGAGLAAKEIGELTVFCRRMGIVRSGNSKLDAKLSAILAAAHHILGNHEAAKAARRFEKLKNAITSDAAQALVLLLEAVVKNDSVAFRSGKEAWGQTADKTSQALVRLRAEYEFYNDYFGIA